MKLTFLILIIGFSCMSLVSAELIINTQPLQISQKINTEKQYQMILNNTFDFEISNFRFSNTEDLGLNMPDFTIPANTQVNINFYATPVKAFNGQIISKISFKREVPLSEDIETRYINITDNNWGSIFEDITIREGSTIMWRNLGDENKDLNYGIGSNIIQANGTHSITFNEIGRIYWQVFTSGMAWHTGYIDIINKTTKYMVHNPNYDEDWTLNVEITSNPTNLSTSLSKDNFEIEYMTFKKGLMTVENIGNEIGEKVSFSSDSEWISFSKNEITLNPEEEDWVEYTITPLILNTNQTNKTYNMNIITKASNSEEVIKQISIFVPYKVISNEIGDSDLELLNWLDKVFCPGHPTSFLCDQSISGEGNGTVIYKDINIPVNMTATDFYDNLRRLQRMEDSNARTNNKINLVSDKIDTEIPALMSMVNQSLELQKGNERSEGIRKRTMWIMVFLISLAVMITGIIKLINKRSYKKYLAEGAYRYRR